MQETIKNLAKAFVGESQARNRYTMYASIARKEGYEQIAEIFTLTADQEREHAKKLFDEIQNLKKTSTDDLSALQIEAEVPTSVGTTLENLKAAIGGENYEHTQMYPGFAEVADQEGLPQVATRMRNISKAEEHHEERYQKILKELEAGTIFAKAEEVWWVCRECGYQHFGKEAPKECPSCNHAQAFYQVKCEQY